MRTPTRSKRMLSGTQVTLENYIDVKQKHLTSPESKLLELAKANPTMHQAEIARQMHLSRARVSQIVKKLEEIGYTFPRKHPTRLNKTITGGYALPLDVRWRALQWKLSKDVKLPSEKEWSASGVYHSVWHMKDAVIELILGRQKSMLISVGEVEGNTDTECKRKHDERCLETYRWLTQKFPDLKEASSEYDYRVCREGELHIRANDKVAAEIYNKFGNVRTDTEKCDSSPPREKPEHQLLLGGIDAKFGAMEKQFEALEGKLDMVGNVLGRIAGILEKMAGIGDKAGGDVPIKPINKEDGGMYR